MIVQYQDPSFEIYLKSSYEHHIPNADRLNKCVLEYDNTMDDDWIDRKYIDNNPVIYQNTIPLGSNILHVSERRCVNNEKLRLYSTVWITKNYGNSEEIMVRADAIVTLWWDNV